MSDAILIVLVRASFELHSPNTSQLRSGQAARGAGHEDGEGLCGSAEGAAESHAGSMHCTQTQLPHLTELGHRHLQFEALSPELA